MSLCLDCNCALCCDGTLFRQAKLQASELPIRDKQFTILEVPAEGPSELKDLYFKLPCRKCKNNRCSIYSQERPLICGKYRCRLLVRHEQGEISTEDALHLVNEVKTMRDRLRIQMEAFTGCESDLPFQHLLDLAVEKLEKTSVKNLSPVQQEMSVKIALLYVLLVKNFDERITKYKFNSDNAMQLG